MVKSTVTSSLLSLLARVSTVVCTSSTINTNTHTHILTTTPCLSQSTTFQYIWSVSIGINRSFHSLVVQSYLIKHASYKYETGKLQNLSDQFLYYSIHSNSHYRLWKKQCSSEALGLIKQDDPMTTSKTLPGRVQDLCPTYLIKSKNTCSAKQGIQLSSKLGQVPHVKGYFRL